MKFLESLGLPVRLAPIDGDTFLPGVRMESGGLTVDLNRLLYPGDLLHEAGHLALMDSPRRAAVQGDAGPDAGEEMGAMAWSFAAALHLGIDPRVVFHPDGYKGSADSLRENYLAGYHLGLPMLQWRGLALDERTAQDRGQLPYPHMQRWLRE